MIEFDTLTDINDVDFLMMIQQVVFAIITVYQFALLDQLTQNVQTLPVNGVIFGVAPLIGKDHVLQSGTRPTVVTQKFHHQHMLLDEYWLGTGYRTVEINTFVIPNLLFGPNGDHFPWIALTISIPISVFPTHILVPIFEY